MLGSRAVSRFAGFLASGIAVVAWGLLALGSLWAIGALYFDFPLASLRPWVAGFYGLVMLLVGSLLRPSWRAKWAISLSLLLVMLWWFSQQPSQDRNWKPEVARTAFVESEGDIHTIHDVRNFQYRSASEFSVHYDVRRVDLRNLKGADIFVNYWGSPYMAHPIISFDFGRDGRICFSIETRPEQGEVYSALGGLYRQFELIYVVADERDVIRLRTNFRKNEDVYLYKLKVPLIRESFLEYVQAVNELHHTPRWYHAVTNNCTSAIRHQRVASMRAAWDYRLLINGWGDQLLYERKGIDTSLPFVELKKISKINVKAQAANDSLDFSEKIREGLPGME